MLSVILSNRNHARFLPAAIESLAAQTRPADEIIIIDDGSTDNSLAVINSYLARLHGARLIVNKVNQGTIANMNEGTRIARGDLILFAAADDVYYPKLFETGVGLLEAFPKAGIFSAPADIVDEDGRNKGLLPTPFPLSAPGYLSPGEIARALMNDLSWFLGTTAIFRKDALLAAGGFLPELHSFADSYTSHVIGLTRGACFSPEALAGWRRMEGGMAWSQSVDLRRAQELIAVVGRHMEENAGVFPPGYVDRWKRRYLFGALRVAVGNALLGSAPSKGARRMLVHTANLLIAVLLFLALRYDDVAAVARRRIANLTRPRKQSS